MGVKWTSLFGWLHPYQYVRRYVHRPCQHTNTYIHQEFIWALNWSKCPFYFILFLSLCECWVSQTDLFCKQESAVFMSMSWQPCFVGHFWFFCVMPACQSKLGRLLFIPHSRKMVANALPTYSDLLHVNSNDKYSFFTVCLEEPLIPTHYNGRSPKAGFVDTW